jgi:hypothetical protein
MKGSLGKLIIKALCQRQNFPYAAGKQQFSLRKVTPTSTKTLSPSLTRHFPLRWRFFLNLHQAHKGD